MMAQSSAGLVAAWKASTSYVAGQRVIAPNGDVVTAKVAFPSAATYSTTNWNASTQDARVGTLEAAKWLKPTIDSAGYDANNITTSGFTGVLYGSTPNLPVGVVGGIEVLTFGTGIIQRHTTWEATQRVYLHRYTGSAWGTWGLLGGKWDYGNAAARR